MSWLIYDVASAEELNQVYIPQKQVSDRDMSVFNRPTRQVKTDLIKDENGQPVNTRNAQAGGPYTVSIIIRTWMTPYGTFVRVTNNVFMDVSVRVWDTDGKSITRSDELFIPAYNVAEYIVPPGAKSVWVTAAGDRTIF